MKNGAIPRMSAMDPTMIQLGPSLAERSVRRAAAALPTWPARRRALWPACNRLEIGSNGSTCRVPVIDDDAASWIVFRKRSMFGEAECFRPAAFERDRDALLIPVDAGDNALVRRGRA